MTLHMTREAFAELEKRGTVRVHRIKDDDCDQNIGPALPVKHRSPAEELFAQQIRAAGLPEPRREAVLVAGRRWRWDFAFPSIAIEIQGGIWKRGGHTTGKGITRDCEKACAAALAGYRTLFFTTAMVRNGTAIALLKQALKEV